MAQILISFAGTYWLFVGIELVGLVFMFLTDFDMFTGTYRLFVGIELVGLVFMFLTDIELFLGTY